ncbi:MAG: hypothetical protein ABR974_11700 [Bacteroidales bacterium]|jgi:hypothetical protein
MIVYLKNHEIDREMWDACIAASPSSKPYACSWYLDIMAPGWEALIDDDYDSVFPVPARERFGFKYIATPIFLQQLGTYSPDKSTETATTEFLDYMPEFYRLIDLSVGQKTDHRGFKITERYNYELDLEKSYDRLFENFSSDCRRNINLASKKKIDLVSDIRPDELIKLFITNTGSKLSGVKPRDYERLEKLMDYCINSGKGKIVGVRDSSKSLIFGIFHIDVGGSVTLLFTANSEKSREKRTGYYAVNEIIRQNAASGKILDFAGSSIPSIASFMESFGSINHPYYRIFRNSLPWPVRLFK